MSNSLQFGATGELMHPTTPTAVGVHLLLDYDLGDAQAVTAAVEALLLDGERVIRTRSSNRTIVLPLVVRGSSRLDLSERVDALMQDVLAGGDLTWSPAGGLPLVWECFSGQPDVHWAVRTEGKYTQRVDVTLPALPFGRSPDPETVTVTEVAASTNGRLYSLTDLLGSAPAPLNVAMTFPLPVDAWLLHQPPAGSDPAAPILNPFPSSAQTVTVTGAELLRGTYTLAAGVTTYGAPDEQRTMDVTITQGSTGVSTTIQKAYTSGLNLRPLVLGNVTLPLVDRPASAASSLTFDFDDSGGTELHTLMLLDTAGRTVASFAQAGTLGNTVAAWVDEPDVGAVLGPMWNSPTSSRTGAYAVAEPRASGGALSVSTADEGMPLLVYSAGANPDAPTVTYRPRWLAERVA